MIRVRLLSTTAASLGPKKVVIIGGSGFLGKYITKAFVADANNGTNQWKVQIASRSAAVPKELEALGNSVLPGVKCDVTSSTDIQDAIHDADVVVNLVGIMHESKPTYTFDNVQSQGAKRIADACKQSGVKHVVHVSAIGADLTSQVPYARTKAEAERAMLDVLGERVTVLRPSLVFGKEDDFFNRFAKLARLLPFVPVFGGGKSKFQPVYVWDVANAVVKSVESSAVAGKIVELGGPKVYTYKELMRLMLDQAGSRRLIISLPWLVGFIQASLLSLLPRNLFTITADQLRLLKKDNVVTGPYTLQTLGITPTPAEDILHTYLRSHKLTETGKRVHKMYSSGDKERDIMRVMNDIPQEKREKMEQLGGKGHPPQQQKS